MMKLVALQDIGDSVGVFQVGQVFGVMSDEYGRELIAQKRAKLYEPDARWDGLNWVGQTVVILASGPSLSEEQAELARAWRDQDPTSRKAIAINTTFRRAPWADVLYGCDARWWQLYIDEVRSSFQGQLWTQDAAAKLAGLRLIKSDVAPGLSLVKGTINQGSNSGYQAIGLAHQAGAKRVILLGYDMHEKGGSHWHGDHPELVHTHMNFAVWLDKFTRLAHDLKKQGVEVVNATPKSALAAFPKKNLKEALS